MAQSFDPKRLYDLRCDHDLSQRQVAAILQVSQRTYSDYERGRTRIPVESLMELAYYYHVSMDDLCGMHDVSVSRQQPIAGSIRRKPTDQPKEGL